MFCGQMDSLPERPRKLSHRAGTCPKGLCSADHIVAISCRVNPFGAFRRNDDKMVLEFFCDVRLEEWNKKVQDIPCRGRIHFQPDHSGMTSKGEDDPIAEMPIESYKHPLFIDSLPEDLSVIGSRLAGF